MKIGDTFYHTRVSGKRKCHVRGIVDDKVVFRWWSKSKQYWVYEINDDLPFKYWRHRCSHQQQPAPPPKSK